MNLVLKKSSMRPLDSFSLKRPFRRIADWVQKELYFSNASSSPGLLSEESRQRKADFACDMTSRKHYQIPNC